MTNSYSDIVLEQYVLDELSTEKKAKIARALEDDIALRVRVENIQSSNIEIDSTYDEQEILREINYRIKTNVISKKSPVKESTWVRLTYAMPVIAVLAFSFLMVKNELPIDPTETIITEDGVRIKGLTPHLNVYQQTLDGPRQLENHVTLKQGDTLQLSYIAAGQQYGMILSVDGRGVITQHFPFQHKSVLKVNSSGEFMLERSYELDDAPEFEHFFFITANERFDVEKIITIVEENIETLDADAHVLAGLPENLKQSVFTVQKVEK